MVHGSAQGLQWTLLLIYNNNELIYNDAFLKLVECTKELDTPCSEDEILKARNEFFVHNLIEEICYSALP